MKPMNWISPTGRSPCAPIPTHRPLIRSSASGVSMTRSAPKRCCSPAVARKTPPLMPTSSPSTTTFGSSSMARASARLMASTSVISATFGSPAGPLELLALAGIDRGKLGIEVVEHRLGRPRWRRQIALHCRLDALMAFGDQLLLVRLAPCLLSNEIRPQARDGLLLPARLDLLRRTVTAGIIGSGVVAQPIGQRLDETRALAFPRRRDRVRCRSMHCDDVIAVHLLARKAC